MFARGDTDCPKRLLGLYVVLILVFSSLSFSVDAVNTER